MAANEGSEPVSAPSPAASHSSQNSSTPNLKAKKDRACPFCRQYFTSSSLGRHLDLYIKERNPKPPDGVHNVEQIKKMRAGITRRQTKQSHAKRTSSPSLNSSKSPAESSPIHLPQSPIAPQSYTVPKSRLTVNWQATGVINNLPPRPQSSSIGPRLDPSTSNDNGVSPEIQLQWQEDKDSARAAEMALKEILRSIQAASARVKKPNLFEFDPFTMNFAALALRILALPKTLFSTTPSATLQSCPISVPDQSTYESLHREISDRVSQWRRDRKLYSITSSDYADGTNGVIGSGYPMESDLQPLFDHLQAAWTNWQNLSENARLESWQLEILRAYSDERSRRQHSEKQVARLQLELEQLHTQSHATVESPHGQFYRGVNSMPSPLPHQASLSPLVLSPDIARELRKWDMDDARFDFDTIMSRWKETIQNTRRGMPGKSVLYPGYPSSRNGASSNRIASPIKTGDHRTLPPPSVIATSHRTHSDVIGIDSIGAGNRSPWSNSEPNSAASQTPKSVATSWDNTGERTRDETMLQRRPEIGNFEEGKGPRPHIYPPYALPKIRGDEHQSEADGDVVMDEAKEKDESSKRKRSTTDTGWHSER